MRATRRSCAAQRDAAFQERFVSVLGRDLRQRLQSIALSASTLLPALAAHEAHARPVRRILAASERMARMIADLLDLHARARARVL